MPITIDSGATLLAQLGQLRLLSPGSLAELALTHSSGEDPRGLARQLVGQGLLTPYQINQLFAGKGAELVLGTYVILERLGEGGMARVFKARHQRLDRLVALKIIRPDLLKNAEAVRRFRREVRAAAQLSHPNIVLALDADEVNGTHFLVMEYVEGIDLSRLVKSQGPLPIAQACDYVRQVAGGLQHAHERGLVHRDIKPSNLLVTGEGQAAVGHRWGLVKLLDMGLALTQREEPGEHSALTRAGELIGTPEFLAPEQAANPHAADIRADLYSLGCTLYFLLAGRPPFDSGNAIQKLFQHRLDEARPVEQLRPDVPTELGAIVRKLLAKRPEDRYPTPNALAEAVRPWVEDARPVAAVAEPLTESAPVASATEPPTAVPAALATESRKPAARRRRRSLSFTALGALVLLLLLCGFASLLSRNTSAPPEKSEPETPEARDRQALQHLMARAEQPQANLGQLRQELLAFRAQHAGTDIGKQAASLVSQFPSPLDALDPRAIPPESRFDGHAGAELVLVQGDSRLRHGLSVHGVALSPDGKTLVSGGDGRQVCFWDLASGKRTGSQECSAPVTAVAFSPTSPTVAVASSDGIVRLGEVSKPKDWATLRHASPVRAVAFSADGKFLATATNGSPGKAGGTIRLWDTGSGKELFALEGFHGAALAVAFAPNGALLASAGDDKVIHLWDVAHHKEVGKLEGHQAHVVALAFSADGQILASGSHDKTFRLWDVAGKKERSGHHDFGHPVVSVAAVPKTGMFLFTSHDSTARLWDGPSDKEVSVFRAHFGGVLAVAVSADGQRAVTGGQDGNLHRWDLNTKQEVKLENAPPPFMSLALSGDDQMLATGHFGGRIRLWDLASGKPGFTLDKHQHGVGALAFAPDGKSLLSGGWDGLAILWDLSSGKDRFLLQGHTNQVSAVGFALGAPLLATGSHDNTARVWDATTGKDRGLLNGHGQPITAVVLTPDGKNALTGSHDRTLRLWDASTGKERTTPAEFAGDALAMTADRTLAAGAAQGGTRVWDVTGSRLVEARSFPNAGLGWVKSLAFSADGRLLVAGGHDGTIVFWSLATGRELRRWSVPGSVNGLACAADGRHLVCWLGDGTYVVFRLAGSGKSRS